MEWSIVILAAVVYLMIGGFINGLCDIDLGGCIVIWPIARIVRAAFWLINIAEDVGYSIRDAIENIGGQTE